MRAGFVRRYGRDLLAVMSLAAPILFVYGRVLFTNLVPASGDFLSYYAPYWDYINDALRQGRLPLWNPLLFAGAPLLANPQTSLFYPLRWPFALLPAEQGLVVWAALHAWLTGAFTYALARRAGRVGRGAAWTAGLIFALNGWAAGLLGHPNRWATLPWLPAALWLWELRPARPGWGWRWRRWLAANAVVWALALLAGHSQTFYNQALIVAAWALAPVAGKMAVSRRHGHFRSSWRRHAACLLEVVLPLAAIALLALGLTAIQLLPTLELAGLSFRSGGLPYRDHAAMSLPPWRLGFSLLPHFARDLGRALGTDAYGEWVGYVGWAGLALALVGLGAAGARRWRWQAGLLALTGLLLSFGAYNPLDYLLYGLMPGWNLFRAPSRWLEATMLGMALLAGLGVHRLLGEWRPAWPRPLRRRTQAAGLTLALGLASLAVLTRPNLPTLAAWAGTLLLLGACFFLLAHGRRWAVGLLVAILLLELYGGSWALPVQHPTAPQALRSWRTAPARIAAEAAAAPDCRLLSLSRTTYDPGDLDDLRRIYGPSLDETGFRDLVVATKNKEVLAPNLGLVFDLPSLDGFDGGLLPTGAFVRAMGLLLPPDQVVADGRLREQLHEVPDARLLSLFHVCYLIVDKDFDVWHDDVYYDLAFGEPLDAAHPDLVLTDLPGFPITAVGLVSHLVGGAELPDGAVVAELTATMKDGRAAVLPIRAGKETFEGGDGVSGLAGRIVAPAHGRDLPAVRWRYDAPGQDAIARLLLPSPGLPAALHLRLVRPDVTLFVRGLAVIDDQSQAHATPPVSRHPWQRIHSGDVKVYRNDGVLPRAFLVPAAEISPDDATTLARLADPGFDPTQTVLLSEGRPLAPTPGAAPPGAVQIVASSPESLHLDVQAAAPAVLVVADAWYPGWEATVDGERVPIARADLLLRGLPLSAGQHVVRLSFRPASLRWGAAITLASALLVGFLLWRRTWRGAAQAV
ncbi:MAG: YfhO family protein [Caldilineales bacterium]|nr:YfhO family protein [Caldilineales bacterium]